jgi:hypothetical protein
VNKVSFLGQQDVAVMPDEKTKGKICALKIMLHETKQPTGRVQIKNGVALRKILLQALQHDIIEPTRHKHICDEHIIFSS